MKIVHAIVIAAFFHSCAAVSASAQSAKDLVGTWTLVSNLAERTDGSREYPFGTRPVGILIAGLATGEGFAVNRRSGGNDLAGQMPRC